MQNEDGLVHKIDWKKVRSDRRIWSGWLIFLIAYAGLIACWAFEYWLGMTLPKVVVVLLFLIIFVDVLALASYSYGEYVAKK